MQNMREEDRLNRQRFFLEDRGDGFAGEKFAGILIGQRKVSGEIPEDFLLWYTPFPGRGDVKNGIVKALFWFTMEAAAYCGIMKPELRPGFFTRKDGSPRLPLIS